MTASAMGQVLGWLRQGYPEGVPPKDFHPLLALLRRTLTPEETEAVVAGFRDGRPRDEVSAQDVHTAIQQVVEVPPSDEDVRAVAARLAAAGWPLSAALSLGGEAVDSRSVPEDRPALLTRVLDWLRRGYPEGVPAADYIPLVALLRRRLSDDEVRTITRALIADGRTGSDGTRHPVSAVDAQVLITKVTDELPRQADVARVRDRLADQGWPLE